MWQTYQYGSPYALKKPRDELSPPAVRFCSGRPYIANCTYMPEIIMPFDDRLSRSEYVGDNQLNPLSPSRTRHISPQGRLLSPDSPQGARLMNYGLNTKESRHRRPATMPAAFNLTTTTRSRRTDSVLGHHPPGKEPGVSLDQRLAVREIYRAPPPQPINTMMGSVKVAIRDIRAPKQAPKEVEFARIANARACGLFRRSFAGSLPLAV